MNSRRSKSYRSNASTSSFASNRAVRNYHPPPATNSNHMSTAPLLSSERGSNLSKSHTTAASGSSFASNHAYRNYSPATVTSRNSNRFASNSNHFVPSAPQIQSTGSRHSSTSRSSADLVSSFASNRAVRNYSPGATNLTRNSNRSFGSNNHFVQKPLQSSSSSSLLTSSHSYDDSVSVSSFASNRAVHNYAPKLTSSRNSNRLTPHRSRRSIRAPPLSGSETGSRNFTSHTPVASRSNFVSNLAAMVHSYVPPVSSWHSISSYNSVTSDSSFASNRAVRGYGP
ncbi:hypothetical protein PIB30_007628 [Stylosanthes scabra]|uniref:Uncharacterized protein n=1 Tax=Stylosanthes scabra TaxID=79078 RepID=A0ABU6V2W7_9FABA|nr:hypothetical protein [Stylosanthes scabra]